MGRIVFLSFLTRCPRLTSPRRSWSWSWSSCPPRDLLGCVRLVCRKWRDVVDRPTFVPWKKAYLRFKLPGRVDEVAKAITERLEDGRRGGEGEVVNPCEVINMRRTRRRRRKRGRRRRRRRATCPCRRWWCWQWWRRERQNKNLPRSVQKPLCCSLCRKSFI